ncbi:hypothetical protein C0Q70_00085 [Pomacea canaliculata]|uniref:SMB domain-containing protein n=1 Tax=Pomacea canaliculata TaxID=400727 RepID=A0A2T7PVP0_POMCA|nr:hypothetical protein C0Q70_00085 [Pomacea canaliculata]
MTGQVYQNLFCAICNGRPPLLTSCFSQSGSGAGMLRKPLPHLTLLLGLVGAVRSGHQEAINRCLHGQVLTFDSSESWGRGGSLASQGLPPGVDVSSTRSDVDIGWTRPQTFNSSIRSHTDITSVKPFLLDNVNCSMAEGGFWNRKTQKAKDYLAKWCPQSCGDEYETTPSARAAYFYVHPKDTLNEATCTPMNCFPCHCVGPCDPSSSRCCSKAFRPSLKVVTFMGCLLNQFLVVLKCPQHQSEEERAVREGCESDLESYIMAKPVTDMESGRTFRNRNCATCHNASSLAVWTRSLHCEHFQYVYTATSEDEMITIATASDTSCIVNYLPPDNVSLLKCEDTADFFSGVIHTCNVTGRWATYDEEIEKHCLEIDDLFYRVKDMSGQVYQNLFCAICNGRHLTLSSPSNEPFMSIASEPVPPLTLLLGVVSRPTEHEKQETSKCLRGQGRVLDVRTVDVEGRIMASQPSRNLCFFLLSFHIVVSISGQSYQLDDCQGLNVRISNTSFPFTRSCTNGVSTPSNMDVSSTQLEMDVSSVESDTHHKEYFFFWNKTRQTPEGYLEEYCPQQCVDDNIDEYEMTITTANTPLLVSPTRSKPLCTNMNCFPCDCDGACDFSSTRCCSLAFRTSSAVVSYVGCLVDSFLAVMKCPEHWSDEETTVREDCERNPENHLLAEPGTDMESGKTFRNRNCATCHNASSLAVWTRSLHCEHFQYVYTATSEDKMITMATASNTSCTINFLPPKNVSLLKCEHAADFFSDVIHTCNVTGRWEAYDEEIEKYCLEMDDLFYRVKNRTGQVYQNLFCAICNGDYPQPVPCASASLSPGGKNSPAPLPPLTLLLGVVSRPEHEKPRELTVCHRGQWQGLDGTKDNDVTTNSKQRRHSHHVIGWSRPRGPTDVLVMPQTQTFDISDI